MEDYSSKQLNDEQLERLAFEMHNEEYWCDIDSAMQVYELINGSGYQQFVFEENKEKLSFGIPLKTVEDLIRTVHYINRLPAKILAR